MQSALELSHISALYKFFIYYLFIIITGPQKVFTTAEPYLKATQSYNHYIIITALFWPKQKLAQSFSYSKNLFNTVLLLTKQTLVSGLLVTGLTGYHCSMIN